MEVMMYNLFANIKRAQSVDCILQPFLYIEETRTQLLYHIVVPGEDIRPEIFLTWTVICIPLWLSEIPTKPLLL